MTRGATARLFVAVDPPAEVSEELLAWTRRALTRMSRGRSPRANGDARVLEREALHLTLCFLGGRPVSEIDTIGGALADCAASVGELELGAPLWLPPRHPRVLAVEVHDREGGLERLHGALCGALAHATDWQPERRRFKAHITVARIRGGRRERRRRRPRPGESASANGSERVEEPSLPATPQLRFTPAAVVLYRSFLSRSGASYEALASCELLAAGS
ncbi:MAG TPA: RNA 2',3'-cyclic phosphodiesterase [Solirubrobacteraceae bacterium]|jgi:2'-5' RNA ligase|nr:RNA 2',3'-cyclic phosphodiesterase [Solirubrobacteraceae bacterium]